MTRDLRMKDFEGEYRRRGAYHFDLKGFSRWWMEDQYRLLSGWIGLRERVLVLACGDGRLIGFLSENEAVGLDHSLSGLKLAAARTGGSFVQAKMEALPFLRSAFDSAVCSLSLQYLLPDQLRRCLGDLSGVVKRGGKLAVSYPRVRSGKPVTDHAGLPFGNFGSMLEESGFTIIKTSGVCFPNPRILVRLSTVPVLALLSRLAYWLSRTGRLFPRRAYHYVVFCVNTGGGG